MTSNKLKEMIRAKVEQLSGYPAAAYKEWQKKDYPADGNIVSAFWDLVEKAPSAVIIGDYDVDGICASFIMASSIHNVFPDKKIRIRIPRRFSEGYGIHEKIVSEIMEKDPPGSLIITVDNGIAEAEKLEWLEKNGYTVAVTDHHIIAPEKIPKVSFVADPVLGDMDLLLGGNYWCGSGVAYKLTEQYVDDKTKSASCAFAAVATIADCVPLVEGNWQIVRKTLSDIRKGRAPEQIKAILDAMDKNFRACNESMIGFYLAPAFNAPGRLYDKGGAIVLSYLLSPNVTKAKEICAANGQRKKIRDEQYDVVKYTIKENKMEHNCPIWVMIPGLHEGIIGILAGMVAEEYGVPAIVLTDREDGTLKGSARTAGDIDIFGFLSSLKEKAEPVNYLSLGGHRGAAGLSITKEEYEKARLYPLQKPQGITVSDDYIYLYMHDIPEAWNELSKYAPYGEKNPQPLFAVPVDIYTDPVKMLGKNEEHLIVEDPEDRWKVTHFYHNPGSLEDKNKFYVAGPIELTAYQGGAIPTLSAETAFDFTEIKEQSQERWNQTYDN